MDLREAQDFQDSFDREYWQHYGKGIAVEVTHVGLHTQILAAKLAEYADTELMHIPSSRHLQIVTEDVIPDLIAHGLRLARILGADAHQLYFARETALRQAFGDTL